MDSSIEPEPTPNPLTPATKAFDGLCADFVKQLRFQQCLVVPPSEAWVPAHTRAAANTIAKTAIGI
jgi:hypothetical protein